MRYATIAEAPESIRALRPPVNLGQANQIAGWAANLKRQSAQGDPVRLAISMFEASHTPIKGKWKPIKPRPARTEAGMSGKPLIHMTPVKMTPPPAPAPVIEQAETAVEPSADDLAEALPDTLRGYYVPWGVVTFAQLQAARQARMSADELEMLTTQFQGLVSNIMSTYEIENKAAALRQVMDEFIGLVEEVTSDMDRGAIELEAAEALPDLPTTPLADGVEHLREVAHPRAADFAEAAGSATTLAYINTQIIEPGWGNRLDNHFYPAEVVKRDASRFVGAKMYETDHNQAEKSTRTWVSTITDIVGFTETGAPIARVAIHDPGFAERVRNLNSAKLLDKLECSILAGGRAKPGFEHSGRRGKLVESIEVVSSVDWVTRAGAGGKALSLAESDQGDQTMAEPTTPLAAAPAEQPTGAAPIEETNKTAVTTAAPVEIREQDGGKQPAPTAPARLAAERVHTLLSESKLPTPAQDRLAAGFYTDEAKLHEAITAERDYLAKALGSGKPVGMGESSKPAEEPAIIDRLAEVEAAKNAVNEKFMGKVR